MLTGWHPPFKYNRGRSDQERRDYLPCDKPQSFSPDDSIGMVRFNSTCIEFLDRTFKIKGMAVTLMFSVVSVLSVLIFLWLFLELIFSFGSDVIESVFLIVFSFIFFLGIPVFIWRIFLQKDLFQYTHYPIRFNRKTRKVHFFRHNGPGGVVTVPWGDPHVYFHIGHGGQNKNLRDLRCHLLDERGKITQTLTVGHFWPHENYVREEWELIRRYMEQGPAHCYDDERDRVITLSPAGTLRNCWMMVCLMMGTLLFPLRWNLLLPIYGALTLSRWLTFKSCRKPVFPPEIEAECAVEPGDPYALPEPRFMAEFANDEAIYNRAAERNRNRQQWT